MAEIAIRTARQDSIISLLNHFHSSATDANLKEYFGCFDSPRSRFLGTDALENWSVLEFWNYSKPHFDKGSAWTYIPRSNTRKIEQIDDFEGVPVFATFDELLDSSSFGATSRGTGTAIYDATLKCWFIVSYHLSFPTPNDLAVDICKKISSFEKKSLSSNADAVAAELLAEYEINEKEVNSNIGKKSGSKKKGSGKS
mmetsp:Transcript_7866/g.7929  ORF Transcript_7866/g.7929 Transcript_7866/m.7929 type:complete len:198 (+) Transcript_7866:53-646(+)|eukprot:CAMPEP_0119035178 /NCGR_PEP_ID=MMETSP1177-20130426/2130_1 /TAXON_ID=2985 /ORGANISM="Ochromonas sp, Strain CCMP1899" /LENGTH=197 /DNA_ID=CAMNT_0006993135 /DNA_START=47 /DNA_END=640 /DNA_ORIENTATION=+